MPYVAILHVAIAIYFAVHAVRTGRNTVWLFVLLSFPFLGSLVYFFAGFLPEQRHGRLGRRAGAALRQMIDPQRELREARLALEQTPSMGNRRCWTRTRPARPCRISRLAHRACSRMTPPP